MVFSSFLEKQICIYLSIIPIGGKNICCQKRHNTHVSTFLAADLLLILMLQNCNLAQ